MFVPCTFFVIPDESTDLLTNPFPAGAFISGPGEAWGDAAPAPNSVLAEGREICGCALAAT